MNELAVDNFNFDENSEKFSKRVENTVRKGEIARYEQFLPFPQCFQKTCTINTLKRGLVWERVNDPDRRKILKISQEDKMPVTNIFSFSYYLSYPVTDRLTEPYS